MDLQPVKIFFPKTIKYDKRHVYFVVIFIKNTDLVTEWLYTNVIRDTAHQNVLQAHSESVVSVRGFTATILQLHADNDSFSQTKQIPAHTHKSVKSMQDMTTATKPKHENTYMLINIYNS